MSDEKILARLREYAKELSSIDPTLEGSPFFAEPHATRNRARAGVRQEVGIRLLALLDGKD